MEDESIGVFVVYSSGSDRNINITTSYQMQPLHYWAHEDGRKELPLEGH
jgi:hypothetical protein